MTSAFDPLARVCLHEYAHLAVATGFGACGFVRLQRVAGSPRLRFAGAFQLHGTLAAHEWRQVALAGTLAELLDDDTTLDVPRAHALLLRGALPADSLDAHLAQGFDRADVAASLALVRDAWSDIRRDALERCAAVAGAVGRTC